jgi:hypothetical protein
MFRFPDGAAVNSRQFRERARPNGAAGETGKTVPPETVEMT